MPLRSATIFVFAVSLATALELGVCCANDAIPSAAAGTPETPHPPRMLIFYDGKVIRGEIRFAQGGYEVASQGGGRVFLANEYVWFGANSLPEAYEELRTRLPDQTANGHASLAEWCLKNGLFRQAKEELQLALQLEPDHRKARDTLVSLDATLQREQSTPTSLPDQTPPTRAVEKRPPAIVPSDTSMRHFVWRVQPILVNRCGNAACHGTSSGNQFSLKNVRVGNPAYRAFTEHNYQAAQRFITPGDPTGSPLIVAPQQPGHGGSHRPVFGGPGGDSHQRDLAAWVAAMAGTPRDSTSAEIPDARSSGSIFDAANEVTAETPTESPIVPASESKPAGDPTSDLLKRVLEEERPDAFDPEEFNRQFAPRSSEPSPSSIDGPTR